MTVKYFPPVHYEKADFKHYLEYVVFRGISFVWQVLPEAVSMQMAKSLAHFIKPFVKKRNQLSIEKMIQNLSLEPVIAEKVLLESYENFACNWVAMARSYHLTREVMLQNLKRTGFNQLEACKKEGRGVIMATLHFGWWELNPRIFQLLEIPLAIMVAVQHNPLSDRFINSFREQNGFHEVLHNRLSVRHTLRFLKEGGVLVIVADIDAGPHGSMLPFLGEKASTSRWPAELSQRTDSVVTICTNYKNEQGQRQIDINPVIDPRDYSKDRSGIEKLTTEMNDQMSDIIKKHPEQWFWMQRRWKTVE